MCAQPILPWRLTIPTVKYGFHGFHYIELARLTAEPLRQNVQLSGSQGQSSCVYGTVDHNEPNCDSRIPPVTGAALPTDGSRDPGRTALP